jgi:hypothetical protein
MSRNVRPAFGTTAAVGLATLAMTGVQAADAVPVSGRTGSSVRHTMIRVSDPGGMSRSAPQCSSAVGKGPILSTVHTAMKKVPGAPFGIAATHDGRWDLIAIGPYVGVIKNTPAGQVVIRRIKLPAGSSSRGEALTHGGRYLLVANLGAGADVLNVSKAIHGKPGAVIGSLSGGSPLKGGFEIAITRDSRFAFVTLASSAKIAVFNLHRALTRGFGPSDFVGTIPVGFHPVGIAMSPDGRWLYATNEHAARGVNHGTLSVISVPKAESGPAKAVVSTVNAGCEPVRVIASKDGKTVWVSARASDALVGFSAARLVSDPRHALIASIRVGVAPIGLALVKCDSLVVVADSNRFHVGGRSTDLAVVDVRHVLAGRPARLLGYLPAGQIPREMTTVPSAHLLLVDNYGSGQIESVDLTGLP